MTDHTNNRPLCMWVQELSDESGTFQENPSDALESNENHLRCTKYSDVAFIDDGARFHACKYHAPEEMLEALNVAVPQDRKRKGRISV